jgi:hypothetical protein
MDVASYSITGTGPDGATFTTTTSGGDVTRDDLVMGSWSIVVNALNNTGLLIGTGTSTVQVTAGDSSTTITVRPIEGTGSLALTIKWPSEQILVPAIEATLSPAMGTPQTMDFTITGATATYAAPTLANGYYTFAFTLTDNGLLRGGAAEVVRIVTGQTTSGTCEFTDLNQVGGGLKITVDPQMLPPLSVSLTGALSAQIVGNTQPMSASVSNYTGQLSYSWYVNGVFQTTGQNYTFGEGLSIGPYRIDVIAQTLDGSRAGNATATVRLVPGTGGSITYDANGATGGNVPIDTNVYPDGMTVTVSGNTGYLVKSGYQIAGWLSDPDPVTGETTSYAPEATFIMGNTDVTLHALWIPLALTFSASGTDIVITGAGPVYPSDIVIPEGITTIGVKSFMGTTDIHSLRLPSTLLAIQDYAFYGCSSLQSVEIQSGLTWIGSYVFRDCSSLSLITLPDSLTDMGGSVFLGCSSLTTINIPTGLSYINSSSFNYSGLSSIVIPPSITRLEDSAFAHCQLTSVAIPSSVTYISNATFIGCTLLSDVTIGAMVPPEMTGPLVFADTASNLVIHVPDNSADIILAYRSANNWIYYADKIVAP